MTAAVAKSNRSCRNALIASPPLAEYRVETQSIPNFSETEKLLNQQKSGKSNFEPSGCPFLIAMDVQQQRRMNPLSNSKSTSWSCNPHTRRSSKSAAAPDFKNRYSTNRHELIQNYTEEKYALPLDS
jgi:hypothetical protein